jgi:stage II sporulation protein D
MLWVFILFVSFWPWEKDMGEVKKASFSLPQGSDLLQVVRVALFYEKRQVSVSTGGQFEIKGLPDGRPLYEGPVLSATIRPDPAGLRVGEKVYPVSGLKITSLAQEVQVDKKKYHDTIQVIKNPSGSLTVVNEIDIEDYLKGVLPKEVVSDWPEDALKAQAVISRTYAVFKNIENKDYPFTLSSDVGSQVYGGKTAENAATSRAVDRTRGQILTFNGKIFPAFFHSSCGGRTTRADYQWKIESHPSLKGVECNFCRGTRHERWKAEIPAAEMEQLLRKKGHAVSGLQSVTPKDVDISGRPRFFALRHSGGDLTVPANDFRLAIGPDRLKSTRVKVGRVGDKIVFEGSGWGHGVGLCQYGAKNLAVLGYRYADILRYYYPESQLQNLEEPAGVKFESTVPAAAEDNNPIKDWFNKAKDYLEDL